MRRKNKNREPWKPGVWEKKWMRRYRVAPPWRSTPFEPWLEQIAVPKADEEPDTPSDPEEARIRKARWLEQIAVAKADQDNPDRWRNYVYSMVLQVARLHASKETRGQHLTASQKAKKMGRIAAKVESVSRDLREFSPPAAEYHLRVAHCLRYEKRKLREQVVRDREQTDPQGKRHHTHPATSKLLELLDVLEQQTGTPSYDPVAKLLCLAGYKTTAKTLRSLRSKQTIR